MYLPSSSTPPQYYCRICSMLISVNLNLTLPVQLMNHAPQTVAATPCSRSILHDWQIIVLLSFWISSKNICMHKVSPSGTSGDPSPESVNRCRKRLQFQVKQQEVPVPFSTCSSLSNSTTACLSQLIKDSAYFIKIHKVGINNEQVLNVDVQSSHDLNSRSITSW